MDAINKRFGDMIWRGKDQSRDHWQSLEKTTTTVGTESSEIIPTLPYQPPKTYLELSRRRMGKTTRLVREVAEHILAGNTAVIQSMNMGHSRDIKRMALSVPGLEMFEEMHPGKIGNILIINSKEDLDIESSKSDRLRGIRVKNPRLFVDEYGLIPHDRLCIVDGGYYCSSEMPSSREWKRLLSIANNQYVSWDVPTPPKRWPDENGIFTV